MRDTNFSSRYYICVENISRNKRDVGEEGTGRSRIFCNLNHRGINLVLCTGKRYFLKQICFLSSESEWARLYIQYTRSIIIKINRCGFV